MNIDELIHYMMKGEQQKIFLTGGTRKKTWRNTIY